ncbi:YopX family protein [Streptococcus uberis]|uniref:YopX family protein n=1 Tax=Streptococcus uberis TaxID=1349 RepID=UPI003D6A8468
MIPKFRAWVKESKKMIHVGSIDLTNKVIYYSYWQQSEEGNNLFGDAITFDETILMQSTGMVDKNGVEIFEGDILEVTDTSLFGGNYRGAIVYIERWGVYGFSMLDAKVISTNEFDKHSIGFLMKEFGSCFTLAEASRKSNFSYKVIGNIYQNSDLLESVEVE